MNTLYSARFPQRSHRGESLHVDNVVANVTSCARRPGRRAMSCHVTFLSKFFLKLRGLYAAPCGATPS